MRAYFQKMKKEETPQDERAATVQAIREAMDESSEWRPAREALAELRRKHGIVPIEAGATPETEEQ